jgi:hypothetical protein
VLAADLDRLRQVDTARLNDLLDTLAVFPGARVVEPEEDL